jgi:hypothetical protein
MKTLFNASAVRENCFFHSFRIPCQPVRPRHGYFFAVFLDWAQDKNLRFKNLRSGSQTQGVIESGMHDGCACPEIGRNGSGHPSFTALFLYFPVHFLGYTFPNPAKMRIAAILAYAVGPKQSHIAASGRFCQTYWPDVVLTRLALWPNDDCAQP